MAFDHDCHAQHEDSNQTTLTAPCCEQIAATVLDSRATSAAPEKSSSAPSVVAILQFAAPLKGANALAAIHVAAYPRGRPPGDQLARFSSILRI
jgi:hypothetical protein